MELPDRHKSQIKITHTSEPKRPGARVLNNIDLGKALHWFSTGLLLSASGRRVLEIILLFYFVLLFDADSYEA